MTGPTVADELAFEALSDDVKALVARIYGRVAVGPTVSEAEAKAYQQGWNDCIEEFESPHELSDTEAARRITRNREREAKAAEFRARREPSGAMMNAGSAPGAVANALTDQREYIDAYYFICDAIWKDIGANECKPKSTRYEHAGYTLTLEAHPRPSEVPDVG